MNLSAMITDNVAELLVKILEFTQVRHKVLAENIYDMRSPDFLPRDLDVQQFAELMEKAIDSHQSNGMLLLRDTQHVKFGMGGCFELETVVDEKARGLLKRNVRDYLELQKQKLRENLFNYRLARELLKQKQGMTSAINAY
jgi:flagellar basal body rod protein FlgB